MIITRICTSALAFLYYASTVLSAIICFVPQSFVLGHSFSEQPIVQKPAWCWIRCTPLLFYLFLVQDWSYDLYIQV
jgi:hypothetical protein